MTNPWEDEEEQEDDPVIVPGPSNLAVAAKDALGAKERQIAELRAIEDGILKRSMTIVEDALAFREIDANGELPPESWIRAMGFIEANRRFRVAKAAWMNAKTAPVGLQLAQRTMNGIIKARATEATTKTQLNIGTVNILMPMPNFPVIEVDSE